MSSQVINLCEDEYHSLTDQRQGPVQVERAWDQAVERRDIAALQRMMADDYVIINTAGEITERAHVLRLIASANSPPARCNREITAVKIYGNAAIITGRVSWGDDNTCEPRGSGRRQARYTKVYVKSTNGWLAVLTQATSICGRPPLNRNFSGSHDLLSVGALRSEE